MVQLGGVTSEAMSCPEQAANESEIVARANAGESSDRLPSKAYLVLIQQFYTEVTLSEDSHW